MEAKQIVQAQRAFFDTHQTKEVAFRKKTLRQFLSVLKNHEKEVYDALYKDLKKPAYETYLSEYFVVVKETKNMLRNLKRWSAPKRMPNSILNFPSKDYLVPEPYGCTLHISPWNYPFQLSLNTVVGAVAAGNTVVLKPSEQAPHTAAVLEKIIKAAFIPEHVTTVLGDAQTAQELLAQRWDYIIYTGSTAIGKHIARAAAEHLTPTTLELGGKSPCIVDGSTPLKITAKRMVWGKFLNCGQTCIAPDYALVKEDVVAPLTQLMIEEIQKAFGDQPQNSSSYGRIINEKHFNRLTAYLKGANLLYGGQSDAKDLFIAPTLILDQTGNGPAMEDEIFGPIFPIIPYQTEADMTKILRQFEKPLGFYVFSNNRKWVQQLSQNFSNGGMVINDSIVQFVNDNMPFGGVGHSGMGSYHGRYSFDTFTHFKPIVKRGLWTDPFVRYAPYPKSFEWLKNILSRL